MSALYDQVAALDRGVADRWKARTNDNPGHKLTAADVDAIVSPLLKTDKKDRVFITEKQAEAIVTLVQTTNFGTGGLDRLRFWIRFAENSIALDLKPLISADELSPINKALAIASHISFTSPGTKIAYAAHDYMAIAELVKQNKIMVFQAQMSDLWKLTKDDGEYWSNSNMLIVYLKLSDDAFSSVVAHEATHAIQDWQDIRTQRHFIEADAYIAAAATLDKQLFVDKLSVAAFDASRFVLDHKAQLSNKDWQKAYNAVVKAYDADNSDGAALARETETGETESDQYKAIVDAIDQRSREVGQWAVDTLNDAANQLAHDLAGVIP